MKMASLFILYNPGESELDKIKGYCRKFDTVEWIIIDNSKEKTDFFDNVIGCNYIHNKNKGGIAGAIARGIENTSDNISYVFTFDQDSVVPDIYFNSMEAFILDKKAKIVCSNFIDVNSNTYAKFVHLKKFGYDVVNDSDFTTFAISSGMGISKDFWDEISGVNENYIIDHVDTEICLKAYVRNEVIYINYEICLEHAIGDRRVFKFMGVTLKPNNHNYIRKYYIVRNGTHLSWKYFFKSPGYFYLNVLRIIHEVLCTVLYEEDKARKIKYMMLGFFHSCIGKLGSIK
ncbi:glycosyltransferase [Tatumella citrea]|uniref:Glycosyltransferase 2-like domain-containing protein n=1 Tax=Tatumella citrea TaxID=53336 RepID=A0A1Y0L5R1_TATCI|nr:glycosyltransferase [Tatumella citrea]ARU93085.1 hypothetical protein A7K98_04285 [Tatumella citrea]ARU97123.1 hypothetical protein A7K99_04285 [Tatumella citrea]